MVSNDDAHFESCVIIIFHTKSCDCRERDAKRPRTIDHFNVRIGPDCRSIRCSKQCVLDNGSEWWQTRCEMSGVCTSDYGIAFLHDAVHVPDAGVLLIKLMKGEEEVAPNTTVALLVDAFILADFYAYEKGIQTTRDLLERQMRPIMDLVTREISKTTLERVVSMSPGLYEKLGELFKQRFADDLSITFIRKEFGRDIFEALPLDVCLEVIASTTYDYIEYDVAFVYRCKLAIDACDDVDLLSRVACRLDNVVDEDPTFEEVIVQYAIVQRLGSLLGSFSSILREGPDSTRLKSIMHLNTRAMKMLLSYWDGRVESENCVMEIMTRYLLHEIDKTLLFIGEDAGREFSEYICKKSISQTVLVKFVTSVHFMDEDFEYIREDFIHALTSRLNGHEAEIDDPASEAPARFRKTYAKIDRRNATLSFNTADLVDDALNPPIYDMDGHSTQEAKNVQTLYLHGFYFKLLIKRSVNESKFEARLRLVSSSLPSNRCLPVKVKTSTSSSSRKPVESSNVVFDDDRLRTFKEVRYTGDAHQTEVVTIEIISVDGVDVICNE